ncbi:MAG: hypothetical protein M1833_006778 [Piccolia ochrophora]|nr:MAG: hypothetical protein M1833_006778 [Piccolia ochrophora]
MALITGNSQRVLHESSKIATREVVYGSSWHSAWNNPASSTKWKAPTFRTARTKQEEPTIPAPILFKSLVDQNTGGDTEPCSIPSVAECAVHLELLQAIRALRVKVLQSTALDVTFGIKPRPRVIQRGGRQIKEKDYLFAIRRLKKWPLFVNFAVMRFEVWLQSVDLALAGGSDATIIQAATLPPLDVLMHNAIDLTDWSFTVADKTRECFRSSTGFEFDLFEYLIHEEKPSAVGDPLSKLGSETLLPEHVRETSLDVLKLIVSEHSLLRSDLDTVLKKDTTRQLAEAVQRQDSFVDKMNVQLWIRSPALEGTLERARLRYEKFLKLFKWYPNTVLVPTLDVDLVWHTHQLSPSRYRSGTQKLAGRFINHDDKIAKDTLSSGMEKTKGLFRIRFGQEYETCTCWDCEAVLSAVDEQSRRERGNLDGELIADQVANTLAFHRAVEIARRKGQPLPLRDE